MNLTHQQRVLNAFRAKGWAVIAQSNCVTISMTLAPEEIPQLYQELYCSPGSPELDSTSEQNGNSMRFTHDEEEARAQRD